MINKFELDEDRNSLADKKSPKLIGFEDKFSFFTHYLKMVIIAYWNNFLDKIEIFAMK